MCVASERMGGRGGEEEEMLVTEFIIIARSCSVPYAMQCHAVPVETNL